MTKAEANKEWALLEGWREVYTDYLWEAPNGTSHYVLPDWTEPNRFFAKDGVVDKLEELKCHSVIKRIKQEWNFEIYSPSGNIYHHRDKEIGIAGLAAAVQARKDTRK